VEIQQQALLLLYTLFAKTIHENAPQPVITTTIAIMLKIIKEQKYTT